jgi:DNA-binding LytR/AlgR family response regulator
MTLSCIIVDDEPLARDILEKYIRDCPMLDLRASCNSAFEALEVLDKGGIQLVFLDINMPKLSGISMIRTLEDPPEIIFTTAYPEYAVEGFELDATDYLVKPFSFERFMKSVNKASKRYEMQLKQTSNTSTEDTSFLTIKADGKIYRLQMTEIVLLEALGDYVKIHTGSGIITTHDTLKNLERSLQGDQFMRVHRSYIIALDKIRFLEGNRLRIGEQDIPLGLSYREHLLLYLQKKGTNGVG